ncbi:hypothetical protein VTI74DRAFT_7457 [Chaetomium olivicolor]
MPSHVRRHPLSFVEHKETNNTTLAHIRFCGLPLSNWCRPLLVESSPPTGSRRLATDSSRVGLRLLTDTLEEAPTFDWKTHRRRCSHYGLGRWTGFTQQQQYIKTTEAESHPPAGRELWNNRPADDTHLETFSFLLHSLKIFVARLAAQNLGRYFEKLSDCIFGNMLDFLQLLASDASECEVASIRGQEGSNGESHEVSAQPLR